MADGDLIPRQLQFPQPFSPYPQDQTKGSLMRNCYRESRPDGEYAVRRNGLRLLIDTIAQGPACKGLVVYSDVIVIVGGISYPYRAWAINGTSLIPMVAGVTTALPSANAATTWYSFTPTLISALEPGLLTAMSGNMWIIQNFSVSTITPILVASPPTDITPGGAFLDGTAYVMSVTDNQIHGSNLQDLTVWNPLNVVGASSSWGRGVGCLRHLNYVLGFYEFGLQVYYNAGLAPPGSPLAPLPNASFLVGCAAGATCVQMADTTVFVGKSQAGNYSVYALSGLSLNIISTPPVDEILKLNAAQFKLQRKDDAPAFQSAVAMSYTDKGHMLYVLKIKGIVTLTWDTATKEWFVWNQSSLDTSSVNWRPDWIVADFTANEDAVAGVVGDSFLHWDYDRTSPVIGRIPIDALVRTVNLDFGSAYKKFIQKISFWGQSPFSPLTPVNMTVRYTDDDYVSYSAAINVDLTKVRKMVNRQGSFYQRAYEFRFQDFFPFRLKISEVLLRGGSN